MRSQPSCPSFHFKWMDISFFVLSLVWAARLSRDPTTLPLNSTDVTARNQLEHWAGVILCWMSATVNAKLFFFFFLHLPPPLFHLAYLLLCPLNYFLQQLTNFFLLGFLCPCSLWHCQAYLLSFIWNSQRPQEWRHASVTHGAGSVPAGSRFLLSLIAAVDGFLLQINTSFITKRKQLEGECSTLPSPRIDAYLFLWRVNKTWKGEVCALGVAGRWVLSFSGCPCSSHSEENRAFLPPRCTVHPATDDRRSPRSLNLLPHSQVSLQLLQGRTVWSCPVWLQTKHQRDSGTTSDHQTGLSQGGKKVASDVPHFGRSSWRFATLPSQPV